MKFTVKNVLAALVVVTLAAMQTGCGDSGGEDGVTSPVVTLSASTVTSSTVSAHAHTVSIPFTDVSASPATAGYQYRSDSVSGHSHVIALSNQQTIDLNNGMQLVLTSSAPSSGTAHTHTWTIQGGSVLYEKNCYNCHSNTKRGQAPASNSKMGTSFSFTGIQLTALVNPGVAPQSTAAAAIPDPNYTPGSTPPDGAALYAGACESCHNALATSQHRGASAATIQNAINTKIPAMGSASLKALTPAQVQAIANALYP
jgi:mono/diheme cytochrome c family protein